MSAPKPKLAIIATHPIQHFVPVYQRLVKDYGVELKVFYIGCLLYTSPSPRDRG